MRSRKSSNVSSGHVQAIAESWLSKAFEIKGSGCKCTSEAVWQVVLLAAARTCSLFAACRDLALAPSDDAVRNCLHANLPKRARTLETRFEPVLRAHLPSSFRRRSWKVAIDWHLSPYHGLPLQSANELYRGQSKSGTSRFHAYGTACVIENGYRYTLAATCIPGNESPRLVLERLLDRIAGSGIRIRYLLLDRQFFAAPIIAFLQARNVPFLMPLALRGRKPRKGRGQPTNLRQPTKLRDFLKHPAGRRHFTWSVKRTTVTFDVVVAYKSYRHDPSQKRRHKRLLYAAWRVAGEPQTIRELYRLRFGIESSYRQLRQARIYTCTRSPVDRLYFVLVSLVLRNIWVWLHWTYLADRHAGARIIRPNRLRYRRMLDWIAKVIDSLLHNATPLATLVPSTT
jgi:hypothetical protein